jgi:serine/threonine protein kinase
MTNDKILGIGGYGIVYKKIWNEEEVAVKRIPLTHISSNEREEEALKKLDHLNVVKLFHVENDENFR